LGHDRGVVNLDEILPSILSEFKTLQTKAPFMLLITIFRSASTDGSGISRTGIEKAQQNTYPEYEPPPEAHIA
jgi:hypothetical protein